MKTVIDAVNYLNASSKMLLGKIDDDSIWTNAEETIYARADKKGYQHAYKSQLPDRCIMVCTVDEFNACVDELSAATWIDGISLEQWKAGMKNTVIDSHGNELEIGSVYEFSDDQVSWSLFSLKGCSNVADDNDYEYEANNCNWIFIRECQSPLGTIKKAPVKLVDGKAYQFEYIAGKFIGIYSENDDIFYLSHLRTLNRNLATNIIPLAPETK